MRGRLWIAAIAGLTLAAGAGEAEAATVYRTCDPFELCNPVFVADRNETNDVTLTTAETGLPFGNPHWQDTFADSRNPIRAPREPGLVALPSRYPEPAVEDSLANCDYNGTGATCYRHDGRSDVYLGDMDDTATTGDDVNAYVYGEAGDDTLRSTDYEYGLRFIGGPGGDTLIGPGPVDYPADELALPLEVDMHFDVDGVADDGRPGEGDNILPGNLVGVDVPGDHVFVGHDGADGFYAKDGDHLIQGLGGDDVLSRSGRGRSRIEGGDGNDYLFSEIGNDVLVGGPGVDRFDSVPFAQGDQTIYARDGEVDEEIDCGDGVDTAYVDVNEGPIIGCETVIPG
jgi:Ca2+-binding RTX toxin-like protein